MSVEAVRKFAMSLPHATEQIQWEDHLLFKVGGKMFALASLGPVGVRLSVKTADEKFYELTEIPGVIPAPYLARNTENYPDSEIVLLDSTLGEINPVAWQLPADPGRVRYLEFASKRIADGAPADGASRHPASRQLDATRDAETIRNYRNRVWVLDGWDPEKR